MTTPSGRPVAATAALVCALLLAAPSDAQLLLDPTFGVDGVTRTAFGTNNNDEARDLLIQPNGEILTAGRSHAGTNEYFIAMTRHSADGQPDLAGFGTGGKVQTHFVFRDQANAIALQDDGKIVTVGLQSISTSASRHISSIYRFNSDGTIDSSFASGGQSALRYDTVSSGEFAGVTVLPDGKILAAGRSTQNINGGQNGFGAMRFLSSGALDPTYDSDGRVRLNYTPVAGGRGACVFLADGGILWANIILVAGQTHFALARVDSAGAPVASFSDGVQETGIVASSNELRLHVLADGNILLAGSTPNGGGQSQYSVFRFDPNGVLDPTFGTGGRTDVGFSTNGDICYDLAVGSDGKILLAGKVGIGFGQAGLARLNPDGSPDTSFGPDGKVVSNLNNDSGTHYLTRVHILPDGKILAAGYDFGSNSGDFVLARYMFAPTNVEDPSTASATTRFEAFPNPSRDATTIRLQLRRGSAVTVEVFDVAGRTVRRLFGGALPAGTHALQWDGRDATGDRAAAGTFFARISTADGTRTTKLIRVR